MKLHTFLGQTSCLLLGLHVLQVSSIQIHSSCTGATETRLIESVRTVFAVLDYAVKRAKKPEFIQEDGTLLRDLLGAPNERDQASLDLAATKFQAALDSTGGAEDTDTGVIIHCNDDHLQAPSDGFFGTYFDNSEGRQAQVRRDTPPAAGQRGPCKNNLRALAYPFGFRDGRPGGTAIVLCSNWDGAALTSTQNAGEVDIWRKQGDLSTSPFGIETLGKYLSYMIIHELMHAGDMQQFPAKLPDGNVNEIYGYPAIAGHAIGATGGNPPSQNNRLHNADSFAFLASAWFLNKYKFINGNPVFIRRKADQAPENL